MKPSRTIYIKHSGSLTAKEVFEMISENTSRTEEYEQSKKKEMKTITRSVITLMEIPKEFHDHPVLKRPKIHTYLECHIDGLPDDDFTKWLVKTYPTIKRKISFLIHINF